MDVTENRVAQKLKQRQPRDQQDKEKSLVRQLPPRSDQLGLKFIQHTDIARRNRSVNGDRDTNCSLIIHAQKDSRLLDSKSPPAAQINSVKQLIYSKAPVAELRLLTPALTLTPTLHLTLISERYQMRNREVGRVSPLRAARLQQNGAQRTDAPYFGRSRMRLGLRLKVSGVRGVRVRVGVRERGRYLHARPNNASRSR